jgi:uncharacterized protein YbcI
MATAGRTTNGGPLEQHARPAAPGIGSGIDGGELNAAVARAVVGIYREIAGRGPTRARAFFRDSVVVVVLESVMTKAEISLAGTGQRDTVEHLREALPRAMRPALIAAVQSLTGAEVRAHISGSDVQADIASEVFVLDRVVGSDPPGAPVADGSRLL